MMHNIVSQALAKMKNQTHIDMPWSSNSQIPSLISLSLCAKTFLAF